MSPDEVEATETGAATGYGDEAAASEKVVNVDQVVSTQDITEDLPVVTTAEAEGRGAAVVIIYASLEDRYCMKACGEALAPGSVYEGQTVRAAYRDLENRCDFLIGTLYVLNHTDPVEAVGFREAALGGARKVARVESVAPYIADSMEEATPGGPEIVWWMGCNPGQYPEAMYKLGKAHGENVLAVRGPVLTTNFNCNIKEVELESTEENIDEMKAEMSEKDLREALEDFIKNDPYKPLTYYNHVIDVPHPRGLTWGRKLRNLVDKLISTGSIVLRFTKSDLPKLDQEVLIKVIEHLEEPLEYYDYVPGVPHGGDLYLPDADKLNYLAQILKRTGTIPYISYNADPGVRIAVPYWCKPQPVPLRKLTEDEKQELTVGSQPKPPVEVRIRP
jgi:hypothetical protein